MIYSWKTSSNVVTTRLLVFRFTAIVSIEMYSQSFCPCSRLHICAKQENGSEIKRSYDVTKLIASCVSVSLFYRPMYDDNRRVNITRGRVAVSMRFFGSLMDP